MMWGRRKVVPPSYTASFSSFAGRNATFLLALISIASPVAGFRPIRAARVRTGSVGWDDPVSRLWLCSYEPVSIGIVVAGFMVKVAKRKHIRALRRTLTPFRRF
jgi:hypothetical protein